ncbi:unnamed protein product, partial [Rotaria sordida]
SYNRLSWLLIDAKTNERASCLPIHMETLLKLYHAFIKFVQDLNMRMWRSTSPPLFQGTAQPLMHCWSLSTCLTTPGMYLSHILPFLPKLRVINLFGGIDQLIALAKFRLSTLIQLNVFDWIDASIDFLDETYFPSLQFLSIILYKETTTDEVLRIERTIERSFTHLPNLISLHYYSTEILQASLNDHDHETIDENEEQDDEQI